MKTDQLLNWSSIVLLAAVITGCDSGGGTGPSAQAPSDAPVVAPALIADQVDPVLQKYYPEQGQEMTSVELGLYSLKKACIEAGAVFDPALQECVCTSGGMFTTGTASPECDKLVKKGSRLVLKDNTGIYQQFEASLSFSDSTFKEELLKKPFRLSFFGHAVVEYPKMDELIRVEHNYNPLSGMDPFEENGWTFPIYEPNDQALSAALGLEETDAVNFGNFTTPVLDIDRPLKNAILNAYENFQVISSFLPDMVRSPYASGCATYCVASEPVRSDDTNFKFSFKKVYQLGTPSARLIVLQDSKSFEVAAVIFLNVDGVVSKVVTVARNLPIFPLPNDDRFDWKFESYDRKGNYIDMDFKLQHESPFQRAL